MLPVRDLYFVLMENLKELSKISLNNNYIYNIIIVFFCTYLKLKFRYSVNCQFIIYLVNNLSN